MIFVTVGTHEQPFNRLIKYMDCLKENHKINDEVIMQIGYCTYEPGNCKWSRILPYDEMVRTVSDARIVITHGGPASFIMPLQVGKIPIVVPRQKIFGEHVNDHQVEFAKAVSQKMGMIIPVLDIVQLQNIVLSYDQIIAEMPSEINSNNATFNKKLNKLVSELLN